MKSPCTLLEREPFQCACVIPERTEAGEALMCGQPIAEGNAFRMCADHAAAYMNQPIPTRHWARGTMNRAAVKLIGPRD